jgi:putative nucleotidyltransferase with HDIG domain
MWTALAAAIVVAVVRAPDANWNIPVILILATLGTASDLMRIDVRSKGLFVSASFLAVILIAIICGETPAALVAVATILVSWTRERYKGSVLLINVVTYAWFPLLAGLAFHGVTDAADVASGSVVYYLLVFATFIFALAIDFALIAGYLSYEQRSSFRERVQSGLVPILPSELASALLTMVIAAAYVELGTGALAMFGVIILVFQHLVGALLVSQERAEELELRARQLAGFQVALLSALLRTLDLRDRMTARHSAAVARYAREIAAQAGFSEEDQELVHSAALLHDIGKFVLPDNVLKSGRRRLTDEEWEAIKTPPAEGARIVSQIDGYQPIGEIILAHHERIDGKGYPNGLAGDDIPALARIISVADTYDVMTARDTYRDPVASQEAVIELRRVSGTQLDENFVEAFIEVLDGKDLAYRHGEDADFEAELALDKRIHDYVRQTPSVGERASV